MTIDGPTRGCEERPKSKWDEILVPFRRQVEESGLSDEELMAFFQEAVVEVRREKRARAGENK